MKVPLSWLKEYVNIDITPKELAEALTMSGSKVEGIEELGSGISNVAAGKIISLEKHPDADKLQVAKVDAGSGVLQIVTGADNIKEGDIIPVAKEGAALPGGKTIGRGVLRGVESVGMMCSIQELGLTRYDYPEAPEHGIFILDPGVEPGTDIKEVLGLDDVVIEFEITPNRPDCLSIIGIARETAVTLRRELKAENIMQADKCRSSLAGRTQGSGVSIEIKNPELCPRYIGRVVRNIRIEPSPEWMRKRLRAAGIRPINNLVDVTNYVMLELGQPMHAFDFDRIEGKKIIVRTAKEGEKITTLDEQERKLNPEMLVIADAVKPVAVAGVMGGANSEVSRDTKNILLEAANFNGGSVRLTAKAMGFRTESSSRFEKGLDIENVSRAMDRAVELLEAMGAGEAEKDDVDCCPVKWEPRVLKFRPDRINALLGTRIDKEYMVKVMRELGLLVDEKGMTVTIPSYRMDIEGEADLAEEVARFYGYNNIESSLFSGETTQGGKTLKQKVEDMCKYAMNAQGLSEAYTYSFVSPKTLDMINIAESDSLRNSVKVMNPLSEEQSMMRTTTIPSMLEVLARNYSRRIEEVRLFELGYVYTPKALPITELPEEKEVITLGMYGSGEDFYTLKGVVDELFRYLGIRNYEMKRASDPVFHPGRSAQIYISGRKAGIIGEIHPDVLENYNIDCRAYIGVVEFRPILENVNLVHKYKHLPKFPAVDRDIAMVVKDEITVGEIESVIKSCAGDILEELTMFDVYKGGQIPQGSKSVAYSMSFRAADRTLTDEEVNQIMHEVIKELKGRINAELRG